MIFENLEESFKIIPVIVGIIIGVLILFAILKKSYKGEVAAKRIKMAQGIFIAGLVIVAIILFYNYYTEFTGDPGRPDVRAKADIAERKMIEETRGIKANIIASGGVITITNKNHFPWTPEKRLGGKSIRLQLNSKYYYHYQFSIEQGGFIKVPLREFVTTDGIRFNNILAKPVSIGISCGEGVEFFDLNPLSSRIR